MKKARINQLFRQIFKKAFYEVFLPIRPPSMIEFYYMIHFRPSGYACTPSSSTCVEPSFSFPMSTADV
jgi:hypothetical protein